jgi:hypothetical protein
MSSDPTSKQSSLKILTAFLAVALIGSAVFIIDVNNKYIDLSEKYATLGDEKSRLQSTLDAAEASNMRLNATLAAVGEDPFVIATTMIIDEVGIDYFNKYLHDPQGRDSYISANDSYVVYRYRIDVGDYSADHNVTFYFYSNYILHYGIPTKGNLQPFNVSAANAKRLALEAGLSDSPYGLEVRIVGAFGYDTFPLPLYADKYVWQVTSYADPPWARWRGYTYAMVDPVTGEVYETSGRGGDGLMESQVDTQAEAAARGIDHYVKLEYPALPNQIQIVKGGNLTFTMKATLISYNPGLLEVDLTVDPQYVDPYMVQSNMADKLRGVVSYKPNGVVTLRAGETMNITVMVVAANDAGQVFLFPRLYLDGLGIGAEGVPVLSDINEQEMYE